MKVFLLAYNEFVVSRQLMFAYLVSRSDIFKNWYSPLQGAVILVSEYDLNLITGAITGKFPGLFFFMVEIKDKSYNGWLPRLAWDFINKEVGKELALPFMPKLGDLLPKEQ